MSRNRNTHRAYTGAMKRLMEGAENLSLIKGDPVNLMDMFNVIALRQPRVSRSTLNVEICALRDFISTAKFDEHGRFTPKTDEHDRPWMIKATRDEWEKLSSMARMKASEVVEYSRLAIRELERHPVIQDEGLDGHQVIERAGLANHHQEKKKSLKDESIVTWKHLKSIELILSLSDPGKAIYTVKEGKQCDTEGLARIFVTAIWATGMRPVEVWNCIMMAPRMDRPMTPEIAEMIRKRPRDAIDQGHMVPIERIEKSPNEKLGATLLRAMSQTNAPGILAIKSAKQTNANKDIASPIRLQVIENPPIEVADMICLASQLRYFKTPLHRQELIRKSINATLKKVCKGEPELEGVRATLYAFRHSFATRVKMIHDAAETAALTGHTDIRSVYTYGKRNVGRSSSGKSSGTWIPSPDPVQAEKISQAWSQERSPRPSEDIGEKIL